MSIKFNPQRGSSLQKSTVVTEADIAFCNPSNLFAVEFATMDTATEAFRLVWL